MHKSCGIRDITHLSLIAFVFTVHGLLVLLFSPPVLSHVESLPHRQRHSLRLNTQCFAHEQDSHRVQLLFSVACPIICANLRDIARDTCPSIPIARDTCPSIPTSNLIQDSFHTVTPQSEVNRRRRQMVGVRPIHPKETLSHFDDVQ